MTPPTPQVGLATCAEHPELEAPERLVIPALAGLGITGRPVVWDDPDVDWASLDLVVLRNTWDYVHRREEFLAWADHVEQACGLANAAQLVRWNTDKRYLRDLAAAGLPVVPTAFVEPDQATSGRSADTDPLADALADLAGQLSPAASPTNPPPDEVVVKPAVSAGSQDTGRYALDDRSEEASDHVRRLLDASRVVMVQPYLDRVDDAGETALLYFDGTFSHAIRKGPLLRGQGVPDGNGLFVQEEIRPRTPTEDQHRVAQAVMDEIAQRATPLYARVDLLDGDDGPVVLEVELTEPSLFIDHADGAPQRLAAAIAGRLPDRRGSSPRI